MIVLFSHERYYFSCRRGFRSNYNLQRFLEMHEFNVETALDDIGVKNSEFKPYLVIMDGDM